MSAAVAYAPNRYSRVQMNTASLNYAPTKGWVRSSLKGVPLHCIIFRTATAPAIGSLLLNVRKYSNEKGTVNFFGQKVKDALILYSHGGENDVPAPSWEEAYENFLIAIKELKNLFPYLVMWRR